MGNAGGPSHARVATGMRGREGTGALAGAVGNAMSNGPRFGIWVVLLGTALDLVSLVTFALGRGFEVG